MVENEARYETQVGRGERFEFGKNWARFLSNLTVAQIKLAESSLRNFLEAETLEGKSFLDVGSGSGLFSLAARRLGAKVYSFDFDPHSVACTRELRRRFFPNDPNWSVEQGSVLDQKFLGKFGTCDIVYSWGVLHHTGSMWQALENVKPLVPIGGKLFIAIYNDLGRTTDEWAKIKQRYNSLPKPLSLLFALGIIAKSEAHELLNQYRNGTVGDWLRNWREYDEISTRGMSRWHDWIDWIGGYPYERASAEEIIDLYAQDGFALAKYFDRSTGYGCNEFVFRRVSPARHLVEVRFPKSRLLVRRFGRRLIGPYTLGDDGWFAPFDERPDVPAGTIIYLLRDGVLTGPAKFTANDQVLVAARDESESVVSSSRYHLVVGQQRVLSPPFGHMRGKMWEKPLPDLAHLADGVGDDTRSNVFVFEGSRQLPRPHSIHNDIDQYGEGRFSHWGSSIYFSSTDGSNPNESDLRYSILIGMPWTGGSDLPAIEAPAATGYAHRLGRKLSGSPERTEDGWVMSVPEPATIPHGVDLYLVKEGVLKGPTRLDRSGRVVIAPSSEGEMTLRQSTFFVVAGKRFALRGPFAHQQGHLYIKAMPDLAGIAERMGSDQQSPLLMFENGVELAYPHASHAAIASYGEGRFAHWESSIYFSSTDSSDPNSNGRTYELLHPVSLNAVHSD